MDSIRLITFEKLFKILFQSFILVFKLITVYNLEMNETTNCAVLFQNVGVM
jgi:hypothetical protein